MGKKKKGAGKKGRSSGEIKAEAKRRERVVADKTFGMKNKNKSKRVQAKIRAMSRSVKGAGRSRKGGESAEESQKYERRRAKKEREAAEREMASLFTVSGLKQPKLKPGQDPKDVCCVFFKVGSCKRGDRCKFAHDLRAGRRAKRRAITADEEAEEARKKAEAERRRTETAKTQEELETMIDQKRTRVNRNLPTTIVCRYFLDAVEKGLYGWFWECPNGGDRCKYRHCLPPGFVFKTAEERRREKELAEAAQTEESIEEVIEKLRSELTGEGTPVTAESFAAWQARKREQREAKRKEEAAAATAAAKRRGIGRMFGISGRALFSFDESLFKDADDALDDDDIVDMGEDVEDEEEGDTTSAIDGALPDEDGVTDPDAGGSAEVTVAGVDGSAIAIELDESLYLGEEDIDLDELDDLDDLDDLDGDATDAAAAPAPAS
eukprot:PLAT9338.1.p2 GENE.PLAT9338.1~~PLAT9338.1.p2  ORF type:complete len:436 (+),score=226.81 PLAT9338.1:28-1335(+)